jgi:transposase-like protein
MPVPLAPEKRAAILEDLRAGKTRNKAARDHGVSYSTISKIAAAEGIAFDRSQTKKATEAAQVDHAAALVKLAARHAALAGAILSSFEVMTPAQWAKVSPHSRGIILGIASDKARDLAPDSDAGQVDAARSVLNAVFEDIVARHGDET